jgi:hypothetical protein
MARIRSAKVDIGSATTQAGSRSGRCAGLISAEVLEHRLRRGVVADVPRTQEAEQACAGTAMGDLRAPSGASVPDHSSFLTRPHKAFIVMEKLLMANFSDLLFVDTSSTPLQIWYSVDEPGIQPLEITYLKKASRLTLPDRLLLRSTKAIY